MDNDSFSLFLLNNTLNFFLFFKILGKNKKDAKNNGAINALRQFFNIEMA